MRKILAIKVCTFLQIWWYTFWELHLKWTQYLFTKVVTHFMLGESISFRLTHYYNLGYLQLIFFSFPWHGGIYIRYLSSSKLKNLLYIFSLWNCVFLYDIYICWIWTPNLGFYKTLAINELISNTISKPWTNKNQGIRVIRVYATLILRQQYVS